MFSQFQWTRKYENTFHWSYRHVFEDKKEFKSEFSQIKDSSDYFIPTQLFDHGKSPGEFSTIEDNPDIWIVAATFAKIINDYQWRPFYGDPSAQLVTEILDSINVRRMKKHVKERIKYGHIFELGLTRERGRQFITDVMNQSGGKGRKKWTWDF